MFQLCACHSDIPQYNSSETFRNVPLLLSHVCLCAVRFDGYRDSVETHRRRILSALPSKGSVRMLVITEKQYGAIELLVGKPTPYDKPQQFEQLMIF